MIFFTYILIVDKKNAMCYTVEEDAKCVRFLENIDLIDKMELI